MHTFTRTGGDGGVAHFVRGVLQSWLPGHDHFVVGDQCLPLFDELRLLAGNRWPVGPLARVLEQAATD